jgi:hypothetical protein
LHSLDALYPPNGASASGGDHLYLGARSGLLHFDGSQWSKSYTKVDPTSIWAAAPDQVFFSDRSAIFRHDGARAVEIFKAPTASSKKATAAETVQIEALWGSAPNDVWAVGYAYINLGEAQQNRAAIYHFDGNGWTRAPFDATGLLRHVWGTGANDVWAGGSILAHFDGTSWTQQPLGPPGVESEVVSATSARWTRDRDGALWHEDGGVWSRVQFQQSDAVAGQVVDVGERSYATAGMRVYEWDGAAFQDARVAISPGVELRSLASYGGELLAIDPTAVNRLRGEGWEPLSGSIPDTGGLHELWADNRDSALAVSDRRLLVREGGSWRTAATNEDLVWQDLAAKGRDDAWVVGMDPRHVGSAAYHWNGSALEPVLLPDAGTLQLLGADVASDGTVWIVGANNDEANADYRPRVLALQNGTWLDVAPPELTSTPGIVTSAGDSVFVGTFDGRVLAWRGGAWTDLEAPFGVSALHATGGTSLYAIEADLESRRAVHWDGTAWIEIAELAGYHWQRVWGRGENDVWLSGGPQLKQRDRLAHYDGTRWTVKTVNDSVAAELLASALSFHTLEDGEVMFGSFPGTFRLSCLP